MKADDNNRIGNKGCLPYETRVVLLHTPQVQQASPSPSVPSRFYELDQAVPPTTTRRTVSTTNIVT